MWSFLEKGRGLRSRNLVRTTILWLLSCELGRVLHLPDVPQTLSTARVRKAALLSAVFQWFNKAPLTFLTNEVTKRTLLIFKPGKIRGCWGKTVVRSGRARPIWWWKSQWKKDRNQKRSKSPKEEELGNPPRAAPTHQRTARGGMRRRVVRRYRQAGTARGSPRSQGAKCRCGAEHDHHGRQPGQRPPLVRAYWGSHLHRVGPCAGCTHFFPHLPFIKSRPISPMFTGL